jgi:hypothetical protein
MANALYSVAGSTAQVAHVVAFGATVSLAIANTSGIDYAEWSIVGQSHTATAVTITPGSKGLTATIAFPIDPGVDWAVLLQCKANGGIGSNGVVDPLLTCRRIIGTTTHASIVPVCANEELTRNAVVGWAEAFNAGILAMGLAALDPFSLIPRSLWRRNQTLSIALSTDAATDYLSIAMTALFGDESLEGLGISVSHTYAAVFSSRVTIIETANPQHFAFVDIVAPVAIIGNGSVITFGIDAATASVTVVGTSTMLTAMASIRDTSDTIYLSASRPPGVACTVLRHDTAIIELQEVA